MKFPLKSYQSVGEYFTDYRATMEEGLNSIDIKAFENIINLLDETIKKKRSIFTCGNGGSSAIAEHFTCDFVKGASENTNIQPKLFSLSSNMSLVSAIANDINYENIFSYQLERLGVKDDVLIVISSSGESKNIIDVINMAKEKKIKTISLVGFDGGSAKHISDLTIHVKVANYGVIEDLHQSIMHIMAQFIRHKNINNSKIPDIKF